MSRRPRRILLVIVVGLVIALLAGWWLTPRIHPTLETGSAFGAEDAETRPDPSQVDPEEEDRIAFFTYRDGETSEYLFSVRNPGPLPMTISGIDLRTVEEGDAFPMEQVEARVGGPGDVFPEATEPFAPFRLAAEEERTIVIRVRFANCEARWIEDEGEAVGLGDGGPAEYFWNTERIRYRILGLERAAEIALPDGVGVVTPPREDCPGAR